MATEQADLLNRFLSQSSSIDCADVSITFMKYLVGRNVLQAIPVSKSKDWDKTIPLFTKSEYPDGRKAPLQGTAPYKVLYATDASGQKFHNGPTEWLTGIPTVTNADTLGIRPDLLSRPVTSWADLLSPDFKGKAALQVIGAKPRAPPHFSLAPIRRRGLSASCAAAARPFRAEPSGS